MTPLHTLRRAIRRLGLDINRWPVGSPAHRRVQLLLHHDIDIVLDIGANEGQYAEELRQLGYRGRIVSFEPYSIPFERLNERARRDGRWEAVRCAVGERPGSAELNVSRNSVSSSLMPILERHLTAAPDSAYVDVETVDMITLATALAPHLERRARVYVKVDAQGYTAPILAGAGASLEHIHGLQAELSLVPLYQGELLFEEMTARLQGAGFLLMRMEPGFTDPRTGQLLQLDAIFYRPESR